MIDQEQSIPLKILVVEDERSIQRLVEITLRKRGYEVLLAGDGLEGMELALAHSPDLVVTDVMMPRMDGWTFVKQLRALPQFAFVPVIFLTALNEAKNRIQGFQLGADDYMPKPIHPEELVLRVEKAIRQRTRIQTEAVAQTRSEASAEGGGFRGDLREMGLPSLLALLEMERKSGVLELSSADGACTARLILSSGSVSSARMDAPETLKNEEAVYALLRWPAGSFRFRSGAVSKPSEIHVSTTHLLLEGARLSDEETWNDDGSLGALGRL